MLAHVLLLELDERSGSCDTTIVYIRLLYVPCAVLFWSTSHENASKKMLLQTRKRHKAKTCFDLYHWCNKR